MGKQLPAKLFQFRIRNPRLWLALRLRSARSNKSLQQLGEEMLVPVLEKSLQSEMTELQCGPAPD